VYVLNLLDSGPVAFGRAEIATLGEQFDHVALAAETGLLDDPRNEGGNLVVVASDEPIDVAALRTRLGTQVPGWEVVEGADLATWAGDAPILTDDYAPVDQLLTPR
jgi:hypothetical protein